MLVDVIMFSYPILWLILSLLMYALCTYKGKRMEEILNKISYSKQEEIAGKIYSYVYFFSGLICFFTVIQQYHGTSAIVPFLKDFAVSYSICAFFIEIITLSIVKISRSKLQNVLYASAKYLKIHPTFLNFLRLFGVILYIICCLFEIIIVK